MRHRRIVFWLDQPSPHQSSYISALAAQLPQAAVIGVFGAPLEQSRLALGWLEPKMCPAEKWVSPDASRIDELAQRDPETSVHIFGGFRHPMVRRALAKCIGTAVRIGVVSEWRPWTGWLGPARVLHSVFVERRHRAHTDFVLAIGHLGLRWFHMCGYDADRVFPWAYFVENTECGRDELHASHEDATTVNLAFVGRCVQGKGIGTLLRALAALSQYPWHLQIVGEGPQRAVLERRARRLGIATSVSFVGAKTNAEVRAILGRTDLLVLPSRADGWGAVINEALMSGVRVVCTDHCGAADLVRNSDRGDIVPVGDHRTLARVLEKWIRQGRLPAQKRDVIRTWSQRIEGTAAAQYLIAIIEHIEGRAPRPVAPWLTNL